jgi:hypothetical protein
MADEKKKYQMPNAEVKSTLDFIDEPIDLKGFEDISAQTMAIPFIRLLQTLSPQVKNKEASYVEGAEEGMWFNTITKHVYGEKIKAVVLKFERMYLEWRPDRGGLAGYHDPTNAERLAISKKFGDWRMENGNHLSETYIYMVLIIGHEHEGVSVISLSSSAIKSAKEWNRLMTTQIMDDGKRAAPYYLVWELQAEYVSNDKGSWYKPKIALTDEKYITKAQWERIKGERKALPAKQVDYAQLEDHAEGKSAPNAEF